MYLIVQPRRRDQVLQARGAPTRKQMRERQVSDNLCQPVPRPLPVRVRYFRHETPLSYELRLATANHLSKNHLHSGSGLSPNERSFAIRYPEKYVRYLELLGHLDGRVIDTHANPLVERPMCPRCSGGEEVRVRDPLSGYVCTKHTYWLRDGEVAHFQPIPEVVDAELHLRSLLADGRENILGTAWYRFAEELAFASLTEEQLMARCERSNARSHAICLYPETVHFVDLLSQPVFLRKISTAFSGKRSRYHTIEALKFPGVSSHERTRLLGKLKTFSDTFRWSPD